MELKNIEVYDNGGTTADRFTIVLLDEVQGDVNYCICASEFPGTNSIFTHDTCIAGDHLGKVIEFSNLPEWLQTKLQEELK